MSLHVATSSNLHIVNAVDGTVFHTTSCIGRSVTRIGTSDCIISSMKREAAIYMWLSGQKAPYVKCRLAETMGPLLSSPDGTYIFAGGSSGTIYVWESWSGLLVRSFHAHHKAVRCLQMTDDFGFLLSGGDDAVLSAWPILDIVNVDDDGSTTIRDFHSWTDHLLGITDLHVGRGGIRSRAFTASVDRTARVFEICTKQLLFTIACDIFLTNIVVSPSESIMFLGAGDGIIIAVDLLFVAAQSYTTAGEVVMDTGEGRFKLTGHSQAITGLILSDGGTTLLSSSEDGTIRVWDYRSLQCVNVVDLKSPVSCIILTEGFEPSMIANAAKEKRVCPFPPLKKFPMVRRGGPLAPL